MSIVNENGTPASGMSNVSPPNPNLMGGSTRKIELDTLVLSLILDVSKTVIFPALKDLKTQLQESDHATEECFELLSDSGVKRMIFNLQRVGVKMYPYVLKSGDITLFLSERDHNSSIPSGRLQIGSVSCQNGITDMYRSIKDWLSVFNIKVLHDKVSRVDLCVDMINQHITDTELRIFDEDYWVTKARSSAMYRENRKITGVQVGKGEISMRMYDKLLELQKPHNSHKASFFIQKWNCDDLQSCTRVEFQLRREAIKEFLKIADFNNLMKNIEGIWEYLTTTWFRHSNKVVDRENKNQDKIVVSSFWKSLQDVTPRTEYCTRVRSNNVFKSLSLLRAQVRGLLTTLCAGYGHEKEDYFGVMNTVTNIAKEEMKKAMDVPKEWYKLFETRQKNTTLIYDEPIEEKEPIFIKNLFDAKQLLLQFNPTKCVDF